MENFLNIKYEMIKDPMNLLEIKMQKDETSEMIGRSFCFQEYEY